MTDLAPEIIGRRVREFRVPEDLLPSEYGVWRDLWVAITPNGLLLDLTGYEITEGVDGTITVKPVIEVTERYKGRELKAWRGALENGIWRTATTGE